MTIWALGEICGPSKSMADCESSDSNREHFGSVFTLKKKIKNGRVSLNYSIKFSMVYALPHLEHVCSRRNSKPMSISLHSPILAPENIQSFVSMDLSLIDLHINGTIKYILPIGFNLFHLA